MREICRFHVSEKHAVCFSMFLRNVVGLHTYELPKPRATLTLSESSEYAYILHATARGVPTYRITRHHHLTRNVAWGSAAVVSCVVYEVCLSYVNYSATHALKSLRMSWIKALAACVIVFFFVRYERNNDSISVQSFPQCSVGYDNDCTVNFIRLFPDTQFCIGLISMPQTGILHMDVDAEFVRIRKKKVVTGSSLLQVTFKTWIFTSYKLFISRISSFINQMHRRLACHWTAALIES